MERQEQQRGKHRFRLQPENEQVSHKTTPICTDNLKRARGTIAKAAPTPAIEHTAPPRRPRKSTPLDYGTPSVGGRPSSPTPPPDGSASQKHSRRKAPSAPPRRGLGWLPAHNAMVLKRCTFPAPIRSSTPLHALASTLRSAIRSLLMRSWMALRTPMPSEILFNALFSAACPEETETCSWVWLQWQMVPAQYAGYSLHWTPPKGYIPDPVAVHPDVYGSWTFPRRHTITALGCDAQCRMALSLSLF